MKKSSPISLFSFQDIITCLTGIMIVVVLVILLQLVESTAAVVKRLEMQPEYQVLKAKVKALEAEKKKLEGEIDRIVKKLANEGFVSKAPAAVIDGEKAKMAKYQENLDGILAAIAKLG